VFGDDVIIPHKLGSKNPYNEQSTRGHCSLFITKFHQFQIKFPSNIKFESIKHCKTILYIYITPKRKKVENQNPNYSNSIQLVIFMTCTFLASFSGCNTKNHTKNIQNIPAAAAAFLHRRTSPAVRRWSNFTCDRSRRVSQWCINPIKISMGISGS
jgi:hypothetical protein